MSSDRLSVQHERGNWLAQLPSQRANSRLGFPGVRLAFVDLRALGMEGGDDGPVAHRNRQRLLRGRPADEAEGGKRNGAKESSWNLHRLFSVWLQVIVWVGWGQRSLALAQNFLAVAQQR